MTDRWEDERNKYLAAIAANPLDTDVRRVFADRLDDHDEPELADFHRSMTADKYLGAAEWLAGLARDLSTDPHGGEEDNRSREVTVGYLLECAAASLDGKQDWDHWIGLGFETPDRVYDDRKEFWEHFQTLTGRLVPAEERGTRLPVSCAC